MKKIIKITLISFITLFSVNSFSQGNLQFNIARLESYSFNFSGGDRYDTLLVPNGKVLKITSTSMNYGGDNFAAFIDGFRVWGFSRDYPSYLNFPIWLPSGTYVIKVSHFSSFTINLIFSFSGIEFNVVP